MTTGHQKDPDGYTVHIDTISRTIPDSGAALITGLNVGSAQVSLTGVAANCTVSGLSTRTATVIADSTTDEAFAVTCDSTFGGLKIVVATTGASPDTNGYLVSIDGGTATRLTSNDSLVDRPLSAASHSIGFADVAPNCTIGGGVSRNVVVPAGRDTLVNIAVTCPTPTTVSFHVTTTGTYLDPDGYAIVVDSGASRSISDSGALAPLAVAPGVHSFTVSGVVMNCTLAGGSTQPVTATTGTNTAVNLSISCEPPAIVFSRETTGNNLGQHFQLFLVNPDGTNLVELTSDSAGDDHARWSPDGKSILFQATQGQLSTWRVVDPITRAARALPQALQSSASLSWAGSSDHVIGSVLRAPGSPGSPLPEELTIQDTSGAGSVQVTFDTTASGQPDTTLGGASAPDVSFAGTTIAYERQFLCGPCRASLWTTPIGGGLSVAVTDSADSSDVGPPAWSPNGGRIAFVKRVNHAFPDVYLVDADGGNLTQLTQTPAVAESNPRWSPDGAHLVVFADDGNGISELYIVDATTGAATLILPSAAQTLDGDRYPDWRRTP